MYARGAETAGTQRAAVDFLRCDAPEVPLGRVSVEAGQYTLLSLRLAIDTLRSGGIDAVVYAPLTSKR